MISSSPWQPDRDRSPGASCGPTWEVSRISMASEDEVLEVTGYAVGTVTPLGLAHPLEILADLSIFTPEEVSLGSGKRGAAIIIKSADLKRALGKIEVGQFC